MKTARSLQLGHPLNWTSSGNGRAGRMFDPARPSAELDWFSLADGGASRVVDSARPSAELEWFSSADGRAGRVADPARPSAKLVVWSIQLGHPPSWTLPQMSILCQKMDSIKPWEDETRANSIRSRRREIRGWDEDRLVDPTRRAGELDCSFGPTHPFGEFDSSFGPTRPASWTARSVQLARSASWTTRLVQLAERASWTTRSVKLPERSSWTCIHLAPMASRDDRALCLFHCFDAHDPFVQGFE
ncbi:hypothetical protein F2Q69_00030345 [Brassica cretica]|uniref:Uncharacterized protein n=1 Tax=Brassica cretica TaxID=69181 RepID=A0A8S9RYZ2_BRACR|nr:hypothetical protein F2Q69_00030345 [Brassica cretica]